MRTQRNTSLYCKPRAESGPSDGPGYQSPRSARALQPGRRQMGSANFVAPLAGGSGDPIPSPDFGLWEHEQTLGMVGTGWKNNRVKRVASKKKEGGKKRKNWWNEKRNKMLKRKNALETREKWSKWQRWGWRTGSKEERLWRLSRKERRKQN